MEFNPSKCHVIRVTRSRSPLPTSYTLHGQTLEVVSCARYLGVDIFNDLSWKSHVTRISKTANKSLGFLRRNLKAKNPQLRERAYKAIVRPQLEYAALVGIPIIRMIFLRLRGCREGLLDGSLVTTHPVQVSQTCLENLACIPSSSGVLILDSSYFTRLFMDMLLYHSQLMSFSWPVLQELPIHLLTGSSVPGLIIINTHSIHLQLFSGITFQSLLPPWQALTASFLTASRKRSVGCATTNHKCTNTVFILTFSFHHCIIH